MTEIHEIRKALPSATATVYLRLMKNMRYLPLLCVTDMNGREILRKDLPETIDLGIIGDIQLSGSKVTVKPRKNPFTKDLKPISFELECGRRIPSAETDTEMSRVQMIGIRYGDRK